MPAFSNRTALSLVLPFAVNHGIAEVSLVFAIMRQVTQLWQRETARRMLQYSNLMTEGVELYRDVLAEMVAVALPGESD